jgi:heptosyltransferase-2
LTLPVRARRRIMLSRTDRATTPLPGRHHTDEYARILLGRPDGETPSQLSPVRPEHLPPNPLPRTDATRPRIVLVPAGARNLLRDDALRRWPVENYVTLARLLLARGSEVVLSGGPDDAWAAPHFNGLDVTDAIGRFTLPETLALFDAADVVCTHDTGPLHLAGVTSTAIVAIFGPVDPHERLPHRPGAIALWGGEGFACRPCYDGRNYAPCAHNGCVRQITPEDALAQIERLLAARRSGQSLGPAVLEPSSARAQTVMPTAATTGFQR